MRMLRSRFLRKNVAWGIVASFFLQCPMGSLEAAPSNSNSQLIKLDYGADASLKPFLSVLVAKEQVSEDVRRCAESVKKGLSVDVNVVLRALPDLIYHVFTAKDEMRRSVKTQADLRQSSAKLKDVLSAMRALNSLREPLSRNESINRSGDFKYVTNALEDLLGDLPAGNIDDLVEFLRFVGDPSGLGVRQIVVKMASCIDALVECCTTVHSKLDDCCLEINSKLDLILTTSGFVCEATPIFTSTTLTAAGTYCLATDVAAGSGDTVLISGDNIILDLNGHNVSFTAAGGNGVHITGHNVVVRNGFVNKLASGAAGSGTGIFVDGTLATASDVSVENVNVAGWTTGIFVTGSRVSIVDSEMHENTGLLGSGINIQAPSANVDIQNSMIVNNSDNVRIGSGAVPVGPNNICIKNCKINNATAVATGLLINNANNIHVHDTSFDQNSGNAVTVTGNSTFVEFCKCAASGTPNTRGFDIVGTSANVLLKDCFVFGFSLDGVRVTTTGVVNIIDCVAKGNGVGFQILGVQVIVRNSTADGNTVSGFSNSAAANQFYNNVACNNGPGGIVNFVGVVEASVTSPENARGVHNVDCNLTTPDTVEVTASKLDICCFTLNSKVDVLGVCQEASFDSCCFTGTCDIDNACLSVIQWLKTIYRDIRGFVTPNVSDCTVGSCAPAVCP